MIWNNLKSVRIVKAKDHYGHTEKDCQYLMIKEMKRKQECLFYVDKKQELKVLVNKQNETISSQIFVLQNSDKTNFCLFRPVAP